ncbi:MAG: PAAR domain-containing protein [Pseudomonadota bacterium]|nr:PAAR domain-containing protein [Pseudomonadota bacterium]
MSKPIITVGAMTSHGGAVLQGSTATTINGVPVARVGDMVSCPMPWHGISKIVSGDPTFLVEGKPVARHGDMTSCGATLIANQQLCVDDL